MMRRRRLRGFSILELLVVLVIVGILAAIALPSYRDSTLRTRRTVAKTVLANVAAREESWFTDRKSYTSSFGADGLGLVTGNSVSSFSVDANGVPSVSASAALYSISLSTTSAGGIVTAYTLIAAPQNAQLKDTCGSLALTQDGSKTASSGRSDCWSR